MGNISGTFNMDALAALVAVVGVVAFVMGVVVLHRGWRRATNVFFFLLTLSNLVFALSEALFEITPSNILASSFLHISILAADLIVLALIYFVLTFGGRKGLTIKKALLLAVPTTFFVLVTMNGNVFSVVSGSGANFSRHFTSGLVFIVMVSYLAIYCGISFYILFRRRLRSAGMFRQREKGILVAIISGSVLTLFTSMILPLFGFDQFFLVGPFVVSVAVLFVGYVIALYSLWEIKIFTTEFFSLLIVGALFGSIFFANTTEQYFAKTIVFFLGAVAVLLLLRSVRNETRSAEEVELLIQRLARQHEELQALNRRNAMFINTTANQLRDPLSGIRWQTASILGGTYGEIPKTAREYVHRIFESSKRLISIVNDFLNLREIEQGEMNYTFIHFDMKNAISQIIEDLASAANEKKLQLSYEDDGKKSYFIEGDRGKLQQVVSNLIDNAIKYTESGEINVQLEKEKGKVRIHITDHGIGLDPEEMKKLFHKFSRMQEAKKVNTSGSGLGLYIAAEIVRSHCGKIWAESEGLSKGSTFIIELPIVTEKRKK